MCLLKTMLILCALCVLLPSHLLAETRFFKLQHRPAADLVVIVRDAINPAAKVSSYNNTLVVIADPPDLEVAATLVDRFDQLPQMLKVIVEQGHVEYANRRSVDASGVVYSGTVMIGAGHQKFPGHDDGRVVVRSDQGQLALGAGKQQSRQQHSVSQYLIVMEGEPGRMTVGRSVPFTQRYSDLCRRYGRVVESIESVAVDTGFEILPVLLGNQVQVDIRPFLAFQDPSRPRQIVFQELTSRIIIPVGQWYDLGGHLGTRDEVSREILAVTQQSGLKESSVRIRIDYE